MGCPWGAHGAVLPTVTRCPSRRECVAALTAATWPPRVNPPPSHPIVLFGMGAVPPAVLQCCGDSWQSSAVWVLTLLESPLAGGGHVQPRCAMSRCVLQVNVLLLGGWGGWGGVGVGQSFASMG